MLLNLKTAKQVQKHGTHITAFPSCTEIFLTSSSTLIALVSAVVPFLHNPMLNRPDFMTPSAPSLPNLIRFLQRLMYTGKLLPLRSEGQFGSLAPRSTCCLAYNYVS